MSLDEWKLGHRFRKRAKKDCHGAEMVGVDKPVIARMPANRRFEDLESLLV